MIDALTESNPFATRHVRPGAVPFLFPDSESTGRLIERLRADGWRGQIVGPHGTGKSTMLATLLPELHRAGWQTVQFALHTDEPRLPRGWREQLAAHFPAIMVIDGYEQLGAWYHFWLPRYCLRQRRGLLVTTHEPTALPILYRTTVTEESALRVV